MLISRQNRRITGVVVKKISRNLQAFRFICACMVLLSHSMILTAADRGADALLRFSKGGLTLGGFAIGFFFLAAGYFSEKSLEKKEAKPYLVIRALRLLPALWIVVAASVVMGIFVTEWDKKTYLLDPGTWRYLWNGLLIPVHELPGVFTHHTYVATVNGALWTLTLEALCYVGATILCKGLGWRKEKTRRRVLMGVFSAALIFCYGIGILSAAILRCIGMFALGMFASAEEENGWLTGRVKAARGLAIAGAVLLIPVITLGGLFWELWMYLGLPFILYELFFDCTWQVPEPVAKLGDISYEMYLVGFPIQQLLLEWDPSISAGCHFTQTVVLDITLAVLLSFLVNRTLKKQKR